MGEEAVSAMEEIARLSVDPATLEKVKRLSVDAAKSIVANGITDPEAVMFLLGGVVAHARRAGVTLEEVVALLRGGWAHAKEST